MHRTNGDSKGTAIGAQGYLVDVYRDALPGVHDATQLRHQEMNAIQEEIANVIEAEGITLNNDTELVSQMSQLNSAIDNKLKASRILNDSSVDGGFVDDALDNLKLQISTLNSDDIINYSNVSGVKVTDALNTLRTSTGIQNVSNVPGTKVTDALNNLRTTSGIQNVSNVIGNNLTDALNYLFSLGKGFITGCNWFRDDTLKNVIYFTPGKATGEVTGEILEIPYLGQAYKKILMNDTGYQPGYGGCGVPSNISLSAGSHVFIFLIKRNNGTFDIAFDTSITAYNLFLSQECDIADYRRIGFLQVKELVNDDVYVYNARQRDNYHEIIGGIKYEVTFSDEDFYLIQYNQYLPDMTVIPVYQVAAPSSESTCFVLPICYTHSDYSDYRSWLFNSGIFCGRRVGPLLFGVPYIALPAINIFGYNGFYVRVQPAGNTTIQWTLLGFFDNR